MIKNCSKHDKDKLTLLFITKFAKMNSVLSCHHFKIYINKIGKETMEILNCIRNPALQTIKCCQVRDGRFVPQVVQIGLKMGKNSGLLFRSDFSTFWLTEPELVLFGANLTHFEAKPIFFWGLFDHSHIGTFNCSFSFVYR